MGNRPVIFVSWFDAARMANWMHNGQGRGSTEFGAYNLLGATSGIEFTREPGALVWIPGEDEWFKAANYNGQTGHYSLHATRSDTFSSLEANFWANPATMTEVGAYDFPSHYGTYDQSGNVWEWNEAILVSSRGMRGGSWLNHGSAGASSMRNAAEPGGEFSYVGFRFASIPEPSSVLMIGMAGFVLLTGRHRPTLICQKLTARSRISFVPRDISSVQIETALLHAPKIPCAQPESPSGTGVGDATAREA